MASWQSTVADPNRPGDDIAVVRAPGDAAPLVVHVHDFSGFGPGGGLLDASSPERAHLARVVAGLPSPPEHAHVICNVPPQRGELAIAELCARIGTVTKNPVAVHLPPGHRAGMTAVMRQAQNLRDPEVMVAAEQAQVDAWLASLYPGQSTNRRMYTRLEPHQMRDWLDRGPSHLNDPGFWDDVRAKGASAAWLRLTTNRVAAGTEPDVMALFDPRADQYEVGNVGLGLSNANLVQMRGYSMLAGQRGGHYAFATDALLHAESAEVVPPRPDMARSLDQRRFAAALLERRTSIGLPDDVAPIAVVGPGAPTPAFLEQVRGNVRQILPGLPVRTDRRWQGGPGRGGPAQGGPRALPEVPRPLPGRPGASRRSQ